MTLKPVCIGQWSACVPRLRKLACTADLVRIDEGVGARYKVHEDRTQLRILCKRIQAMVEDGVYELAPDVVSLEILGLEEPPAAGFVALESLLGGNGMSWPTVRCGIALQTDGAD